MTKQPSTINTDTSPPAEPSSSLFGLSSERNILQERVRNSALASLTRREHSTEELRRKLRAKFIGRNGKLTDDYCSPAESFEEHNCDPSPDERELKQPRGNYSQLDSGITFDDYQALIESTLQWLADLGYLNDQRFAQMFVRSAISKGQGPLRIRQELSFKGINNSLVEHSIAAAEVDWQSLALDVLQRKFKSPPANQKEKAKQLRFLQSRGFYPEDVFETIKRRESGSDNLLE